MPFRLPLASLRETAESFLPDTCTIQRYTETRSGDGTVQSWSALATGIPCRVSPIGRMAVESFGAAQAEQAIGRWSITMPTGQDVTARDRILVGSRAFEVTDVVARSYEVARAVICREIT
jgi:head-tail adaptor